jgi:LuxR family maltose regulon positive regulatory protein
MVALLTEAATRGDHRDDVRRLLAAARVATAPDAAHHGGAPVHALLVDPLSPRELEVLRLLRSDLDGPDIARELVVSLSTVRTHTRNIYTKLGVTNRRAAVRRADELGLVPTTRA